MDERERGMNDNRGSAKASAGASAGVSPRLARRAAHSAAASLHRCDRCSRGSHLHSLRFLTSSPPTLPLTAPHLEPHSGGISSSSGRYSTPPPLGFPFLQLHPELYPHWSFSFALRFFPASGVSDIPSCSKGEPLRRWSVWGNEALSRLERAELGVEE